MISAEHLDALLELWAKAKLSDGGALRALWYPSSTAEHRFARRGGSAPRASLVTPVGASSDAFERVDRAIAKLRQSRNPLFYSVLTERLLGTGPDESRAKRLNLPLDRFQMTLNSARRWLRQELDE